LREKLANYENRNGQNDRTTARSRCLFGPPPQTVSTPPKIMGMEGDECNVVCRGKTIPEFIEERDLIPCSNNFRLINSSWLSIRSIKFD
jgi:hypothetical protein